MEAQKCNGLAAANNQPAENYTQSTNQLDYPMGKRLRKEKATRCCAPEGYAMSEQLSFLPSVPFCPLLPQHGSAAEQALYDLMERDITQLDWLDQGKGWRLASAMKVLGYLGWEPKSERVLCNGWGKPIARYSLPAKAKQAFFSMCNRGGAHA